ncbi:NADH:ubiquinone reductase (Na(+)-transporting) subunit B [bacterium]|nr:NADH:ubiquinone reductase (Na(+)-transporting) subunit B [bacterium]
MKAARSFFDSVRPHFEKGGKWEKFYPAYDAFETFAFVPGHTAHSGAHVRDAIDLKRTMVTVIFAMIPCLLFGMYNVGLQHFRALGQPDAAFLDMFLFGALKVMPMVVVSYAVGLGIEFAFAIVKKHSINEGYLVSGMLIPLIMPVDIPLWMVAVSTVFAVVIGKEVFGGTGMNILNPALTARAFAFFAYPSWMSGDKVWVNTSGGTVVDGYSGSTILGNLAVTGKAGVGYADWSMAEMVIGTIPGSIGETSKIAVAIGAFILLWTGIASWRIMLMSALGALSMGLIFNAFSGIVPSPEMQGYLGIPFWQHLIIGSWAFATVFMATDPVSGAQTNTGKLWYGFLIGFFGIMIRVFNPAYPEGMMLAILLMNVFAPLIDHYVIEANVRKRLKRVQPVPAKA